MFANVRIKRKPTMFHSSPLRGADRNYRKLPPALTPMYCKIPPYMVVRGLFAPSKNSIPAFGHCCLDPCRGCCPLVGVPPSATTGSRT